MLNRIKIGTKLIGGFFAVALIAGVIGITGIVCQRSLAKANVDLYQRSTVPEGQLIGMTASLQGLRLASRDVILNPDKQRFVAKVGSLKDDLARQSNELERNIDTAETRKHFEGFVADQKRYEVYLDRMVSLAAAGKQKEATEILYQGDALAAVTAVQDSFNKMRDDELASAEQRMQESSALASRATLIMITSTLAGLAAAIGFGLLLTTSIAALVEATLFGGVNQAHNLVQHKHRLVFFDPMRLPDHPLADSLPVSLVTVATVSRARAMRSPAFTYQCSRHEIRPFRVLSRYLTGAGALSNTDESLNSRSGAPAQ